MNTQPRGDNFAYVVPVDYRLHTPEKPFCYDQTCDCHDDPNLIREVAIFVDEGLLSLEEATDFIQGVGI